MTRLAVAFALLALVARLHALGEAPPGIHVDAAANAWSARCLAATGTDWNGTPWPILYSRGYGENQSTLYYYFLLPFQAVFGMSAWSTALPSAVGGALSVLLIYLLAARLFDAWTGLAAAAALAAAPWHLLFGRWGHESGIVPLLVLAPLVLISVSNLPLGRASGQPPRLAIAALAGGSVGVCCYGYYAVRIFLPALLLACAGAQLEDWRALPRTRRGRGAVLAFLLGAAVTLGPLAASHLLDPATSKRGSVMLLWSPADGIAVRVGKVAARYLAHFGTPFLFGRGDAFPLHEIPGGGPLLLSLLPWMLIGAAAVVSRLRTSPSARVLGAWVLLYPLSDCFTRHPTPNLLRSSPGLIGLALLAAVGFVAVLRWGARWAWALAVVGALLFLGETGVRTHRFFDRFRHRADLYSLYNADLLEAAVRIRPRLAGVDAIFVSTRRSAALGQAFAVVLVGLDYAPDDWFRQPRIVERTADTDVVHAFGKIHFLVSRDDLQILRGLERDGRPQRVLFIARPEEARQTSEAEVIRGPDGSPAFVVFEATL